MGASGDGALEVTLGGVDARTVLAMSGGWRRNFTLAQTSLVTVQFTFKMQASATLEIDEESQAMSRIDANLSTFDKLAGGGLVNFKTTTMSTVLLSAGIHEVVFGLYLNKKTFTDETAFFWLDSVLVTQVCPPAAAPIRAPI
jgi:hypothetical protein